MEATDSISRKRIATRDVESSQIAEIGHDTETNTLAIRFKKKSGPGSLYHYANFTTADFAAFDAAESKGKHFGAHIKPFPQKYPYVQIDESVEA